MSVIIYNTGITGFEKRHDYCMLSLCGVYACCKGGVNDARQVSGNDKEHPAGIAVKYHQIQQIGFC